MPSQHIDLSPLSASAAAEAGMRFITPPVIGRISAAVAGDAPRRRQKTSQSLESANCPATGPHTQRCGGSGSHRHGRERVILRNYCSGSPRRNARLTGRPRAVNRRRCDRESSDDDDDEERRGIQRCRQRLCICDRLVLTSTDTQDWTDRQTDRQRQTHISKFGRLSV